MKNFPTYHFGSVVNFLSEARSTYKTEFVILVVDDDKKSEHCFSSINVIQTDKLNYLCFSIICNNNKYIRAQNCVANV